MPFKYNKLWQYLLHINMTKEELRTNIKASPNTLVKMGKNEPVSLDIIDRICNVLQVSPNDIIEYIPEKREYNVGDIFYHHNLLSNEQIENELITARQYFSETLSDFQDDVIHKIDLSEASKNYVKGRRDIITGIYKSRIFFCNVITLPSKYFEYDKEFDTETEIANDTTVIISKNENWLDYVDVQFWESVKISDFTKHKIKIISSSATDVISKINNKFNKLKL